METRRIGLRLNTSFIMSSDILEAEFAESAESELHNRIMAASI